MPTYDDEGRLLINMAAAAADIDIVDGGGFFVATEVESALQELGHLTALTVAEVDQLENIGPTTISVAQWGFVGDMSHGVSIGNVPAFLVKPAVNQENIAINGDVTVVFGTEIYDIGGNFAANVFTAPVTGKYQFNISVRLDEIDIDATYYFLKLITGNRTYMSIMDPGQFAGDPAHWYMSLNVVADMDATDTAYVAIYQAAGAQQTDIITSDPAVETWFSGFLVG